MSSHVENIVLRSLKLLIHFFSLKSILNVKQTFNLDLIVLSQASDQE